MALSRRVKMGALSLALCALVCAHATAYDGTLDASDFATASFIASHGRETFLARYLQVQPIPESGPLISEIEVRTPFAQVLAAAREHSGGYSAQQAKAEYERHPGFVQVRIAIRYTPTYTGQASPPCGGLQRMQSALDCFHDFRFSVSQKEKLQPRITYGVPVQDHNGMLLGGDVWLEFATEQITSGLLHTQVSTPNGRTISAGFDLASLR
jgi:hypothetical protein